MHYFDTYISNKILYRLCPGQIEIFAKLSRSQKFDLARGERFFELSAKGVLKITNVKGVILNYPLDSPLVNPYTNK